MWRSLFYLLKRNEITEKTREKNDEGISNVAEIFDRFIASYNFFYCCFFFSSLQLHRRKLDSGVVVKLMRSHISWVRQPSMAEGGRITLWFDDLKRESTFYAVPDEAMFSLFIENRRIVNFLYTLFFLFPIHCDSRLKEMWNKSRKNIKKRRDENSTRRPSF